jgi:septum formation protein
VLAADTVVALDGSILGKAATPEEAVRMLEMLSGRTHAVHTAVVVQGPRLARPISTTVTTSVRFRLLARAEIERYVASGDPMDKAGAYGIQGAGGALVAEVRGSYSNVVGLPLEETLELLRLAEVLA